MAISGTSTVFYVVVFAIVAVFSAVASAQESPVPTPAPAPVLDRGAAALPAAASMALLFASFFLSLPALLKL
ncbi:hypothetical protein SDJN03_11698, partial [Cucurbita argyrosperma subsp. sororia]